MMLHCDLNGNDVQKWTEKWEINLISLLHVFTATKIAFDITSVVAIIVPYTILTFESGSTEESIAITSVELLFGNGSKNRRDS